MRALEAAADRWGIPFGVRLPVLDERSIIRAVTGLYQAIAILRFSAEGTSGPRLPAPVGPATSRPGSRSCDHPPRRPVHDQKPRLTVARADSPTLSSRSSAPTSPATRNEESPPIARRRPSQPLCRSSGVRTKVSPSAKRALVLPSDPPRSDVVRPRPRSGSSPRPHPCRPFRSPQSGGPLTASSSLLRSSTARSSASPPPSS